jgi:hypothetical protein
MTAARRAADVVRAWGRDRSRRLSRADAAYLEGLIAGAILAHAGELCVRAAEAVRTLPSDPEET